MQPVAVITGASSGIGAATATQLAGAGFHVILAARRADRLDEAAARARAQGGSAQAQILDVTDVAAVGAFAQSLDRCDVLVNNAGGALGMEYVADAHLADWHTMFEVNVIGSLNMTKALLPQFRERRSGTIVNMSSIGGLIAMPGWGYYNASKFAVEGLSDSLRAEVAPLGIHVMTVEPGPFRTDFLSRSGQEATTHISDYEITAGKTREYFRSQGGKQPGDPQRGVEAIVSAVSDPHPPNHLLLGKLAMDRFRKHLKGWDAELDGWESLAVGADYPEDEADKAPIAGRAA